MYIIAGSDHRLLAVIVSNTRDLNSTTSSNVSNEPNTIERYTENVTKTGSSSKRKSWKEWGTSKYDVEDTAVTPRMVSTMLHHNNPEDAIIHGYLKLTGDKCDDFMKKTQSRRWRRMMNS